jgi:ubiquinone/menaquinone biosynthesis C-methylase UbiE
MSARAVHVLSRRGSAHTTGAALGRCALALLLAGALGVSSACARGAGTATIAQSGAVAAAEAPAFRATSHRRFDDVEHWQRVFDDPGRDRWQQPARIVETLDLRPGLSVADIGAGTGYMMPHLAEAVGPEGSVYSVEVEPELVAHLRARAEQDGLEQVVAVLSSFGRPSLPARAVDRVLILDTYHHLDDRLAWLSALGRALAPGARVAIVDWRPGELAEGPPPDHKLDPEQVIDEMARAGYRLLRRDADLPMHYRLLFAPATG